ncbi:MAG: ABC transporter permease [Verrucomicrobiales bacterium]|nr:ABC transporter permease [Verrucomicrobiales bacterium]
MRVFLILLGKELRAFFLSPVAYVVLALFMVISGFSFAQAISALRDMPSESSIVQWTFYPPWFWFYFFFAFPLITMRLFAEEQKLGTLESLLTAPVRTVQVLLAKYAAAMIFYVVLWLPNLLYLAILRWVSQGQVDIPAGSLWGSYAILLLVGLCYVAAGCLASALTRNQIVAAILCFTMILLHYLIGTFVMFISRDNPVGMADTVDYFVIVRHMNLFTKGLFDSRAVVYYTSLSVLLLAMTHQVLEYRRWKA